MGGIEHMFTYDHKIRHALADNVLFEVFGMKKGLESCSLWEKINMMALLAERAGIAPTPFCDLMKKRAKVVSSMLSHASYLKSQYVNLIPQIDLQMTRMKDLLLAPTRWMDFITSSSEQGANKRSLMSALFGKYHAPLKAMRGDRIILQQLYEMEEHLYEIDCFLTPLRCGENVPREMQEKIEMILLRKVERMETLRIWSSAPLVAGKFFKLVREEPPSKSKDLAKFEKKAEKAVKKEGPPPMNPKNISTLAHVPSVSQGKATSRHPVSFSRTASQPPRPSSSSSSFRFSPRGGRPRGGR